MHTPIKKHSLSTKASMDAFLADYRKLLSEGYTTTDAAKLLNCSTLSCRNVLYATSAKPEPELDKYLDRAERLLNLGIPTGHLYFYMDLNTYQCSKLVKRLIYTGRYEQPTSTHIHRPKHVCLLKQSDSLIDLICRGYSLRDILYTLSDIPNRADFLALKQYKTILAIPTPTIAELIQQRKQGKSYKELADSFSISIDNCKFLVMSDINSKTLQYSDNEKLQLLTVNDNFTTDLLLKHLQTFPNHNKYDSIILKLASYRIQFQDSTINYLFEKVRKSNDLS